jgi:hypothetical protein
MFEIAMLIVMFAGALMGLWVAWWVLKALFVAAVWVLGVTVGLILGAWEAIFGA